MNRSRNTSNLLIAALLALLCGLAIPAAAGAAGGTAKLRIDQPAGKVLDYWTKSRMRAAEPVPTEESGRPVADSAPTPEPGSPSYVPPAAPGPNPDAQLLEGTATDSATTTRTAGLVTDPSATGNRAHGKVFFTVVGGSAPDDYVCSGTAVNSPNRSVVLTAGHCVFDAEDGGGKSVNFIFVPAYEAGTAPYGLWAAKSLATTKQWKEDANLKFDLGAVVVKRNSSGQRLQSVVGARGVGFSQPRDQSFDAFGYPAILPFTGELEYECLSDSRGSDSPGGSGPNTMAIACDMTGGASGGGWIVGGKTLVSVTSYSYGSKPILYGPYLSTTAKKLYKSVNGSKKKKR